MINKSQYHKIHTSNLDQNEADRKWRLFEEEQASFNMQISAFSAMGGAIDITDAPALFTTEWTTTAPSETITLPYEVAGIYSGTIDWGDGGATSVNSYENRTHTYSVSGNYIITINGVTTGFRFNNTGDKTKIKSIKNWGNLKLGNNGNYFYGCTNLTLTSVIGVLDLTGTTSLVQAFRNCTSLTTINNINSWNTSAVTNMSSMFNASSFNQALSFNTSAVTNMSAMFGNCSAFNSAITFNTSAVTNMFYMFGSCSVFNQSLTFNTSAVTNMNNMFGNCSVFNSVLKFTSTSAVTDMEQMFSSCSNFNQALSFVTSAVTNMSAMFYSCSAFNQPLSFNTSAVTNMNFMFCACSAFNSTLTFTSTSVVTEMAYMFFGCSVFNQPLSFNTSAVTNMSFMFANAPVFDQNIGTWNVENVAYFTDFMLGKTPATFSTTNLDAIYNGWSTQEVQPSLDISFGTANYTAAATAGRLVLTGTALWIITDGGPQPAPVNTTPPGLGGKFRFEGEPVTTNDGTWDNSPTSFTYQWYRDATPISGETLNEYILAAADVDKYISCEVTAINAGGSATEPSNALYIFDYDYAQVYYYANDTAEAESILQNQFMLAIKAAGVWAKLDVLCVFRGSGDVNALVDWKRLSEVTNIDCVFNTAQGLIGDSGEPAYIDTGFTPNTMGVNYTQNNASRYFFPYAFSGTGPMDGTQGGGGGSRNRMLLEDSIDHKINQNGAVPLSSTFEYTTTVEPKSIHRTSATDVTLFNGTTSASRTGTSDTVPVSQYILRNINDYADHTVAAYAAGASMVAENTDFVAAWNTYITAL